MTVAHPWLELLRFIKRTWPCSNNVTSTWQELPNGFFSKRCTAVQFHNRSPSVTEDIKICQSYMTALSSCHQYLCFLQSNGGLSETYDNFMPAAYLRVQIRNLMPSRKNALNSNSYLEMLWKEVCFVGPVDRFSLHYFIVDCFSFHCTSHWIFQITTQKSFLKE